MIRSRKNKDGFALVELAIVLGVVSLLVGGAISTSNVLQGARETSVRKEIVDIHTAYKDYRSKYGSMPGDTNNAETLFVGASGSNGDGNGELNLYPLEYDAFWTHLSLAKMIKGSYSIFAPMASGRSPTSVLGGDAIYTVTTRAPKRAMLQLCLGSNPAGLGALTPEQAKRIDDQLDDGKPNSGRVVVEPGNGVPATQCASGSSYNLNNTQSQCNLLYVLEGNDFYNYQVSGNGVNACGTVNAPTTADYIWDMGAWGSCGTCAWQAGGSSDSGTCGTVVRTTAYTCPSGCSGSQTRSVQCVNAQTGASVANANCTGVMPPTSRSCSGICPEPAPVTQSTVNLGSCETYSWYQQPSVGACSTTSSWSTGAWSGCNSLNTSCPRSGTQSRTVTCSQPAGTQTTTYTVVCRRDSDNAVVADGFCTPPKPAASSPTNASCTPAACTGTAPATTQSCSVPCDSWVCDASWTPCSGVATWNTPAWGACTATGCGSGTQTRSAATCTPANGSQNRSCVCPSGASFCSTCPINGAVTSDTNSATQDSCVATQSCTDTVCDDPTPPTSQSCSVGNQDSIINQLLQAIFKASTFGSSWVGCIGTL